MVFFLGFDQRGVDHALLPGAVELVDGIRVHRRAFSSTLRLHGLSGGFRSTCMGVLSTLVRGQRWRTMSGLHLLVRARPHSFCASRPVPPVSLAIARVFGEVHVVVCRMLSKGLGFASPNNISRHVMGLHNM